ncbi:hypothetical protein ABMA27_007028 [Loxostege sticticalis]|uniref:Gag-like protein n=1 Tax=Loxostege sticticalis TaxID=481309 RepID=A0ABR3ILE6_LOXSC
MSLPASEVKLTDTENKDCHPTWQRVPTQRYSKRKRVTNSPPNTKRHSSYSQAEASTSNRYSGLPIDLTEEPTEITPENSQKVRPKKIHKPPPIILYGIEDLSNLTDLLNKRVASGTYSYKIINRDQLRIVTQSTEIYKELIDHVRNNGLIGHTFTQKEKKCYRIVVKNLHHTTPKTAIIEEIEKTGNKVRGEIICAISRKNKKPLNMCQQYGHTKNNCMRPYRCVKCSEGHRTIDCPKKDRNTPATCALCFGDHPANYKGCQVYKEIRARKMTHTANNKTIPAPRNINKQLNVPKFEQFPPLKTPKLARQNSNSIPETNKTQKRQNIPYSKVVGHRERTTEDTQPQPTNLLEQVIIKQSEKIDILIQQMGTLMGLLTTLIAQQQK